MLDELTSPYFKDLLPHITFLLYRITPKTDGPFNYLLLDFSIRKS